MSCGAPVSWADLVRYWAGDLAPSELDRLDEHLMSCESCSAESARVAALARALADFIPPVVSQTQLGELRARGLSVEEHSFFPDVRQQAVFRAGVDVLVHRLTGFDLSTATRVEFSVQLEGTGEVFVEDPDVPFDPEGGVLVACQRHFRDMPHEVVFEVRAVDASGVKRSVRYPIPHAYE